MVEKYISFTNKMYLSVDNSYEFCNSDFLEIFDHTSWPFGKTSESSIQFFAP